jgi:hypothetical protein
LCIDGLTGSTCTSIGGYVPGNTVCATNPCSAPIFGACCADGECADGVNDAYCDLIGGEYQGDFTTCDNESCCEGDLDDDEIVNVVDVLHIISAWGCLNCDNEDLNNDGVVDVNDLLVVVGAWGPCN